MSNDRAAVTLACTFSGPARGGPWTRRRLLAVGAAAGLAGCAHPFHAPDRIVEVASGRELTRDELLEAARRCDYLLLGERHDNPIHHARRGALLNALGEGVVVVAEHLTRGARVGAGPDLLGRLQAAGFDPKGWQWPQHRALFAAVLGAGQPLLGGNAPREQVRQVAREGLAAVPAELRALIDAAPLDAAAVAALDRDLVEGHCGQLPAARLPAMRTAQRTRDASMVLSMRAAGGRPTVLVAGNGHVRTDHGVPQLLRAVEPQARWLSVGFGEAGSTGVAGAPFTHLWITAGVDRQDPCAGFRMPAPGAAQRTV